MYSRAPRNIGALTASSNDINVGPGSYDYANLNNKPALDTYAPFMSLSLRDDIFNNLNETPGPGQYELRKTYNVVKGGSSLANKSERFQNKSQEIPGPGAYEIENKENKITNSELKVSKHRVKIMRKKNAPSIQDPKDAYGFEESQNGELIPQAPPQRDPTLGPAYYNTANVSNSSQYKGVHFSKYSNKRTDFSGKFGPGPGEYDIVEPVYVNVEHYHMKNVAEKKSELNVPRYPEALVKKVEKESTPGPGKYQQKRLFDDAGQKEADGIEIERPPFGIQSKRFDSTKALAPGPGSYNDQRTAFNSLNKIHGLKKTPFSQSSVRFEFNNVFKSKSAPGPGQYRLNGFAEENLRKAIIDSNRKPAFGQSAERKFSLAKRDEYAMPGPAQYKIVEKPYKSKKENFSSNFASTTKQREIIFEDTPGPTAYDSAKSYDFLIHSRRKAPRNKNATKRQQSFNVVSRRDFNLVNINEIPGPGSYDIPENTKTKTCIAPLSEKRWKDSSDNLPGPAHYELSTMYQDTILKGTFNATLNNPLVYKKANQKQSTSDSVLSSNKLGVSNIEKRTDLLKVS